MEIPPRTNVGSNNSTRLARTRLDAIQSAMYPAAGLLVIGLIGLIANPSNTGAIIALWAFVLGSSAVLLAIVFLVRGVPQQLEEEYKRDLEEVTERFQQLSARDWITGLLTSTEFVGAVKMELSRSQRYGRKAAIAVIEPDPSTISRIQGREGALDAVARYLASGLSVALRESDVLGRSGDGFGVVALLPETDSDGAGIAGNRILSSFGGQTVSLPDDEQITMPISVAVATFPDDGDSADVLLERAMQRAK